MRYAKISSNIFSCIVCMLAIGALVKGDRVIENHKPTVSASPLDALTKAEDGFNVGYSYGEIYSINGKETLASTISMDEKELYAAKEGFTHIIGSDSGGMIYELSGILRDASDTANRRNRCGNNVVTTLHYEAMQEANKQLSSYEEYVKAAICVVLNDGTVLVDSGNNSRYPQEAFFQPEEYSDLFVNYNISPLSKGSAFKTIISRMMLVHDEEMGTEYSLYVPAFRDVSYIDIANNVRIHNWDSKYPEYYTLDEGGQLFSREINLSGALQLSSNTYMVRHAQCLGLDTAYQYLKEMYGLDRNLVTEINRMNGLDTQAERLEHLFYGQDAYLSAIRLCQMYNYTFSGQFYTPFYICSVIRPDGETIYKAAPTANEDYTLEVNLENDILKEALADCFENYIKDERTAFEMEFGKELIDSRRILSKSGTAENEGSENRIMAMTILSEDGNEVIASACISINYTTEGANNVTLLRKLLHTLRAADII